MGAGIAVKRANAIKRRLEKKYGEPYTILRASNGEVAIIPTRAVVR